jgi:hypothetical protein
MSFFLLGQQDRKQGGETARGILTEKHLANDIFPN